MLSNLEALKEMLPYEQLSSSFAELFANDYGLPKVYDIDKDVETSDKVKRFLADSLYNRQRYNHIAFITVIQTGSSFLFKKAEIVCFASILLLEKWRLEVGEVIGLSNEGYLKKILFDIIAECDKYKTHIDGTPNLFERYNKILLNLQDTLTNLIEGTEERNIDNKDDDDTAQRSKLPPRFGYLPF